MGFEDARALHAALLTIEPKQFVSRYLFEPVPYVFGDDLDLWIVWKTKLAAQLGVDPYEILLTGSSAIGFSLNPKKKFSSFHGRSDIDVGVISSHHFEIAWRYLRQTRPEWLSMSPAARRSLRWHRTNYVFSGTIATDLILTLLPFGKEWQAGLDSMALQHPTEGRDVKLRIYRDYDALRSYQASGIKRLRGDLLDPAESDVAIPIEEG